MISTEFKLSAFHRLKYMHTENCPWRVASYAGNSNTASYAYITLCVSDADDFCFLTRKSSAEYSKTASVVSAMLVGSSHTLALNYNLKNTTKLNKELTEITKHLAKHGGL